MRMTLKSRGHRSVVVFLAVVVVGRVHALRALEPGVDDHRAALHGRGRPRPTLYYSNQCNYCHTLYVRPQDVAMGQTSDWAATTSSTSPTCSGSERTGPDLSYIGRKRSEAWELQHLKHPRDLSPLSIMPNFYQLPEQDLRDIVAYPVRRRATASRSSAWCRPRTRRTSG